MGGPLEIVDYTYQRVAKTIFSFETMQEGGSSKPPQSTSPSLRACATKFDSIDRKSTIELASVGLAWPARPSNQPPAHTLQAFLQPPKNNDKAVLGLRHTRIFPFKKLRGLEQLY